MPSRRESDSVTTGSDKRSGHHPHEHHVPYVPFKHRRPSVTNTKDSREPPLVRNGSESSISMSNSPGASQPSNVSSRMFNLDMDLESINDIVDRGSTFNSNPKTAPQRKSVPRSDSKETSDELDVSQFVALPRESQQAAAGWVPPESWNVADTGDRLSDQVGERSRKSSQSSHASLNSEERSAAYVESDRRMIAENRQSSNLSRKPMLVSNVSSPGFVTGRLRQRENQPPHFVRIFKEDNTFTTVSCPLDISAEELVSVAKRKLFLKGKSEYQLSLAFGGLVKVMSRYDKPLKAQNQLLLLSGYTDRDRLSVIGRNDLTYLFKFSIETNDLKQLSIEEKALISKDYEDVNLRKHNFQIIPILLYQHMYRIRSLDVSCNPSIQLPLDFVQGCNRLTDFKYSCNRATRFPANVLDFNKVAYMDLSVNFLREIPASIELLTNLVSLNLSCNQLGFLPSSLSKLKNLQELQLSSNHFKSFPEVITSLVSLEDLDISYNYISSMPEKISKLSNLRSLKLSANCFTNDLPHQLELLETLTYLDVRFNKCTNVDDLGRLPNLKTLQAAGNKISRIDGGFRRLRNLQLESNPVTNLRLKDILESLETLDLSKAQLSTVPGFLVSRIPNVESLILDSNVLSSLPSEICNLSKLVFFSASRNNLDALPNNFSRLANLQYLDLHSNNIGRLQQEIWDLKSLVMFNISSNLLSDFPYPTDQVVASLKDRSENAQERSCSLADTLLDLSIADNKLDDSVIQTISFLRGLKRLNLSHNELVDLPAGYLTQLTNLRELFLSGNMLTTLPSEDFDSLKRLGVLHLNRNKFHSLPSELSKLDNLVALDVGSNKLKYNISNWRYDWNWHWNTKLRYLNFSGNKRLEIRPYHSRSGAEENDIEDLDSLLVLKSLRVLGLMDVTITTTLIPDQSIDTRVRTTPSQIGKFSYGISDTLGSEEHVTTRDVVLERFRGNEDEILISLYDGKNSLPHQGHKISKIIQENFGVVFAEELKRLSMGVDGKPEGIPDAMRRAFLTLNKEISFALNKSGSSTFTTVAPTHRTSTTDELTLEDATSGCCATVIYIKGSDMYTANVGDTMGILTQSNGVHAILTSKHEPYASEEYERIRSSGGFVTTDGKLDGVTDVSRAVGYFDMIPHISAGPSISMLELTPSDEVIAIATPELWKYVSYDLAADLVNREKNSPMEAAEKLRDYAIAYGASDKITAIVISLKAQPKILNKQKAARGSQAEDSYLRKLDDEIEPPVGEVAMVFTDIKNSTLLWDYYPVEMQTAIKIHNSVMRRQLRIVGGYEVKTEGDAFIVSFPTITSAMLWCFTVQQQLLVADWPSEILQSDQGCEIRDEKDSLIYRGLSVRMGIHWGFPVCERDIVTRRMDYFGPMVNRAARISGEADGGQITVSSDFIAHFTKILEIHQKCTTEQEKDKANEVLEGFYQDTQIGLIVEAELEKLERIGWIMEDLGEKKLKGLETPERIMLLYPKTLASRFQVANNQLKMDEGKDSKSQAIGGAISVELVVRLRAMSMRLERFCSALSGNVKEPDGSLRDLHELKLDKKFNEEEMITLIDHVVTRVENCVGMLMMRQAMSLSLGKNGALSSSTNVLEEASHLLELVREV